jgi:AcrR family transcriptional regulator
LENIVNHIAKPRLDRDARREAILDVARDVFLEEGFAAASMSTIATRLGGSKGTLYNYFKSKDELFEAYVRRHCAWSLESDFGLKEGETDVRAALMRLGTISLSNIMTDYNLRNFRLITSEAERNPEIGRAFYETGPGRGARMLAGFLEQMAGQGRLRIDDPLCAAHQFVGLCQNRLIKARLCNYVPEPTPQEIESEVSRAVDTFMAAFGV